MVNRSPPERALEVRLLSGLPFQMNIKIRSYIPSDFPSVKENLSQAGMYEENWDNEKNLNEKIGRNPGSILVAEENGKVVGNILVIEEGWGAWLFRLAVNESHRKKGIGTMLLQSAEKLVKQRGIKEVALLVEAEKKQLKDFYRKRGYKEFGDYTVMWREL